MKHKNNETNKSQIKCDQCDVRVSKNAPKLICFLCNQYKHPKCQNLSKNEASQITNLPELQWTCQQCISSILPINACSPSPSKRRTGTINRTNQIASTKKVRCASCSGWLHSLTAIKLCSFCNLHVHKKCHKDSLGCVTCCESIIPGFYVTHYELNNDYNALNSLTFNPYDRNLELNRIGNVLDEHTEHANNEHWNEISKVLTNCKYQQPKNVKPSKSEEISVLSLNIRSLYKNLKYTAEQYENILNCDVICFNETNCILDKLPNGIDDLQLEGFHAPILQEPVRKSGKGGGLAIFINKKVGGPENIEKFDVSSIDPANNNSELQLVKIHNCKGTNKTVVVINFYRSPSRDPKKFIATLDCLLKGLDRHSSKLIIIAGDANIDLLKYNSDVSSQDLIETLEKYGFAQTVSKPTRITDHSATLIDHVYTNKIHNILSSNVLTIDVSDHLATITKAKLNYSHPTNEHHHSKFVTEKTNSESRIINEASHSIFQELITNESWEDVKCVDGASEKYDKFNEIYMKHYDTAYPLKSKRSRRKNERTDPKPWILPWLETACARKNTSYFLKITKPTPENIATYGRLKKFCEKHIERAKKKYYKKEFEKYQDCSKKQWQIINNLLNRKTRRSEQFRLKEDDGTILSTDEAIAGKFNDYFSNIASNIKAQISPRQTFDPGGFEGYLSGANTKSMFIKPTEPAEIQKIILCLKNKATLDSKIEPLKIAGACQNFLQTLADIVNISLTEGSFPKALKTAKVTPIHKGGSKLDKTNYRPISLLSSFSKVYEKVMHSRVLEFLDKNDLLFENQFGFRPGRSCEQALLSAQNSLIHGLSKNQISLLLLLDYSKAFDLLDHKILLKKLEHYGIRGVALKWFESYLKDRAQYVAINGAKSSAKNILYGIPQGSILGPLLFVIYINDLPGISNLAKFILYADDANIIITGSTIQEVIEIVEQLTKKLVSWVYSNGLALNLKKTCYMIFSKRRLDTSSLQITIDGQIIARKNEARFLGVIVDEKLTWSSHIKAIKSKMSRFIGVIYKIKSQIPLQARIQIFQSFIQSHLNFCSLVWGFASKSHIETVFSKQKQGIRCIMNGFVNFRYNDGNPPDHTKHAFKEFGILTVHGVIVQNALILMHKHKNFKSLLPQSINEIFPNNTPNYGSSFEENSDWLSVYNCPEFRRSVFYKGPMLAISDLNISKIVCPSSVFSLSIYKKSAKRVLLELQNGDNDIHDWPPFILYNLPGLRHSNRTARHCTNN